MMVSNPNVCIFYEPLDLPAQDERLFLDAMDRLPTLLRKQPASLDVAGARLPHNLREDVLGKLNDSSGLSECTGAIHHLFHTRLSLRGRLVVGCPPDHTLAEMAKQDNPAALWGAAITGFIALTYCPGNQHIVWHEALHTIGAMDCYALPDCGPTCEQHNCLMQYAPNNDTVGGWPWLCRRNIDLLRTHVGT